MIIRVYILTLAALSSVADSLPATYPQFVNVCLERMQHLNIMQLSINIIVTYYQTLFMLIYCYLWIASIDL